jgi:DHA1 family bicyclomycin/chloramphenicol resistance-like MFS transporter
MLGFLTAVGPISTDAYLPAFPTMEHALHGIAGSAQITLATWFAGLAVGQIVQGPMCDAFGRRMPLLFGTVLFTAASAGCAVAWSIPSMSVFRFLAALGASASMVVPRAIVRDLRDGHEARRLMAQLILVMGAVPILAPSLGGLLLIVASWRVIFWLAAFYGVVAFVLVWRLLPDTLAAEMRIRVDLTTQITRYAGIITERGFITNVGIGGMALFGLFAYLGGSPTAYVHQYGLTPAQYALAFSANAAVYIGSAQLGVPLAARFGVNGLLRFGSTLFIVASAMLLAVAITGMGGLPALMLAIAGNMVCMGILGPLAPVAALARHANHAGSASALLGTLQFMLGALAATLVGAFDDGTARPFAALLVVGAICAKIAERLRPKATAGAR